MLGRGRYSQLPLALESAKPAEPASADETRGALAWLRAVLRYRCAHWRLPEGVELRQGRGCVLCRLPGEYEVALTTQNPNPNNPNPNPDPNPNPNPNPHPNPNPNSYPNPNPNPHPNLNPNQELARRKQAEEAARRQM